MHRNCVTSEEHLRRELISVVEAKIAAAGVPGAAVSFNVDGLPVVRAGVGYRDIGRAVALDEDARFYAYSITKTFLAIAVLHLAEDGRIDLDQPIQATLPEIALDTPVTMRQLLTHSGGLPDYGAMPDYCSDLKAAPGRPWKDDAFLTRTLERGLLFSPGHGWAYSNIGFMVVRLAIERLTHGSLAEALSAMVVEPLGLKRTAVATSLADSRVLTPGFSVELDQDEALHDISSRYHPAWVSHGVVITTASELASVLDALFTGRLVGPASLAAMLDAVIVPGDHPLFVRPAYGYGLMVDLGSPYGRVAGHAGGGPGCSTAAFHFPDLAGLRITSVVLANRDVGEVAIDTAFALVTAYADHCGLQALR